MSELWQFLLIGAAGIVMVLLWIFVVYLPRRTAEGEGDNVTRPTEDPEKHD